MKDFLSRMKPTDIGNKQDNDFDWDEGREYNPEDNGDYSTDENGEYYAEDNGEYYAEENGEYYAEDNGEYYAEDNGEYYVEGNGENYAEDNGEYYAEDNGEYYVEGNGENCAEENGEYYAEDNGEYYTEGNGENYPENNGEYYAEDNVEYADEGSVYYSEEGEIYYSEDGGISDSGDDEIIYAENRDYDSEHQEKEYSPKAKDDEYVSKKRRNEYYEEDSESEFVMPSQFGGDNHTDVGSRRTETGGRRTESGSRRTGINSKQNGSNVNRIGSGVRKSDSAQEALMDRIIALTGIAVVVMVVLTVVFLVFGRKSGNDNAPSYAGIGSQIVDIPVIGESGLTAVVDAMSQGQEEAPVADESDPEEQPEDEGYEEVDMDNQVEVNLVTTSIQKDLKIKFTNKKTGKLIANVPFAVNMTDPDGKKAIWSDDDMDGIVYKKEITPGNYTLSLEKLTDEKYSKYTLSGGPVSVVVKKDITYQQVDVSGEVRQESEIDTSTEDTAQNQVVVESELTDTVEWVESRVTSSTYNEIAKKDIKNPETATSKQTAEKSVVQEPAAAETSRQKASQESAAGASGQEAEQEPAAAGASGQLETKEISEESLLHKEGVVCGISPSDAVTAVVGSTIDFSASFICNEGEAVTAVNLTWESSDESVAKVTGGETTAQVEVVGAGEAVISYAGTVDISSNSIDGNGNSSFEYLRTEKVSAKTKVTATGDSNPGGGESGGNPGDSNPGDSNPGGGESGDSNPGDNNPGGGESGDSNPGGGNPGGGEAGGNPGDNNPGGEQSLNPGKVSFADDNASTRVGKQISLQSKVSGFTEGKKLVYSVSSEDEKIAKASVDASGLVTVTGVEAGTAKITLTVNYKKNGTDRTEARASVKITVKGDLKIAFKDDKANTSVNSKTEVTVVLSNASTETPVITVQSSDPAILKATAGAAVKKNKTTLNIPVTIEGIAVGEATVTVSYKENDVTVSAACTVTVAADPKKDKETRLKTATDEQVYVFENNAYREAVYADYYTFEKFYIKGDAKYTGWQTINGKIYFFTKEGKAVTGEQVIQGAKYTFDETGALVQGSALFGIDVSKWNGTIDWNAVKNSGVNYAIIRCGFRGSSKGTLVEDSKFEANIKGATAAGIKVGVYFFTQAIDEVEAVEEASMVLSLIKNYKITYPVFLDVEASGGRADKLDAAKRTAVCKAFCQTIQNAGYKAGIYANKTWLETKLDAGALGSYKIWLAQYASAPNYTGRYDMWQYRATGKVSGITGDVDLNLSYLGY